MLRRRVRLAVSLGVCAALVMPLGACENVGNNQQTAGAVIGGVGGAVLGGLGGSAIGGRGGAVIGAVAGGVLGAWAGSTVGRRLDERDRRQAAAATQQVLAEPRPRNWRPPTQQRASQSTTKQGPKDQASTSNTGDQKQQASTSGWSSAWNSDAHQGVSGSSSVVGVSKTDDGRECRRVQEVAYIRGDEVKQTTRYCKDNSGRWAQA